METSKSDWKWGASAQDPDSPTDLGATCVDDEMNFEMEVDAT